MCYRIHYGVFSVSDQLFFLSIQASLEIFPGVELFSGCPRMQEIPAPPEFDVLLKLFDCFYLLIDFFLPLVTGN